MKNKYELECNECKSKNSSMYMFKQINNSEYVLLCNECVDKENK